eukprot:GHVP01009682.1.p2 GENE.GHVP01009682.1~~GHVP01009682.1.p2  ORF type:complete len:298 (+),score=70.25 GHVP01009682.1:2785-3678(+)
MTNKFVAVDLDETLSETFSEVSKRMNDHDFFQGSTDNEENQEPQIIAIDSEQHTESLHLEEFELGKGPNSSEMIIWAASHSLPVLGPISEKKYFQYLEDPRKALITALQVFVSEVWQKFSRSHIIGYASEKEANGLIFEAVNEFGLKEPSSLLAGPSVVEIAADRKSVKVGSGCNFRKRNFLNWIAESQEDCISLPPMQVRRFDTADFILEEKIPYIISLTKTVDEEKTIGKMASMFGLPIATVKEFSIEGRSVEKPKNQKSPPSLIIASNISGTKTFLFMEEELNVHTAAAFMAKA